MSTKFDSRYRDLRENGKIILAHGEVTGHSHQVVLDLDSSEENLDLELYQYFEDPSNHRRYLIALAPCVLRHQEHDPIYLDPDNPAEARQGDVYLIPIHGSEFGKGLWEVRRQFEYTPQRIVQVLD